MKAGKIARIVGLLVIVFVFGFGIYAANKPKEVKRNVWDAQMTRGSLEAKNYFVVYTDIMCPYCVAFENAVLENEEEFEKYLEDNDVLFEVKLTDFLYEYGAGFKNSQYSAEAVYCAKTEGRFWDYYSHVIKTVWDEFLKEHGKSALPSMEKLTKDYWIGLGREIGLDDKFSDCVTNDKSLAEVKANTKKTADEGVNGIPYMLFNKYLAPGFDLSWGWEYAEAFFNEGLNNSL